MWFQQRSERTRMTPREGVGGNQGAGLQGDKHTTAGEPAHRKQLQEGRLQLARQGCGDHQHGAHGEVGGTQDGPARGGSQGSHHRVGGRTNQRKERVGGGGYW